jgi:hypothetical protein
MTRARRFLDHILDRALSLLETLKLERKLESAIRPTRDMVEDAPDRRRARTGHAQKEFERLERLKAMLGRLREEFASLPLAPSIWIDVETTNH